MTRKTYRDHKGRFTSRRALFNGPFLPADHPILVERERKMWADFQKGITALICRPNPLLQILRERDKA